MKKTLKLIGILILILILFRGIIFRLIVKYEEIGTRPEIALTNEKLIGKINRESIHKKIEANLILKIADQITREELKFTTKKCSRDPNELANTTYTNCVGYASMYNSIANYLINKNDLQNEIIAEHKIGQLELLGFNLHQLFESPFFSDHDFNEITNKVTGEISLVDPSVSDYLWIKKVAKKE